MVLMIKHATMIVTRNILLMFMFIISIIGAIFCHVRRINALFHLNPSITSGNQKCTGAAPSFVNNAVFIIVVNEKFTRGLINSSVVNNIITAVNKTRDAIACVIKYFIAASEAKIFFFSENSGITDSKLISNPIHIPIQEYEEIATNVPKTIEFTNKILLILIKKGKILLSWAGYEPTSFLSLPFYILVYDVHGLLKL